MLKLLVYFISYVWEGKLIVKNELKNKKRKLISLNRKSKTTNHFSRWPTITKGEAKCRLIIQAILIKVFLLQNFSALNQPTNSLLVQGDGGKLLMRMRSSYFYRNGIKHFPTSENFKIEMLSNRIKLIGRQ
jgi:hypothetical protein